MHSIPINRTKGMHPKTKERTDQSIKAPMMYATRMPSASVLAVKELSKPRTLGEEHSLIYFLTSYIYQ